MGLRSMSEAVRKRTGRSVADRDASARPSLRSAPRRPLFAALLCMLLCIALPAFAQADLQAPEYRIKAAFLYKFGGYVEWPPSAFPTPTSALTIGVLGADLLATELQTLVDQRTIGGRPVVVRVLQPGDSLDGVHVVFVGATGEDALADVLAATEGHAVLTVTESDAGLDSGSAINFLVLDGKIRFDVALEPVEARHLKISSRLLAVARRVVPTGPS